MFDFFLGIWTFGYILILLRITWSLSFPDLKTKHDTVFFGFLKDPLTTHPFHQEQLQAAMAGAAQAESEKVQGGCRIWDTLQWTKISHLGKRNILLKRPLNMGIKMGIC